MLRARRNRIITLLPALALMTLATGCEAPQKPATTPKVETELNEEYRNAACEFAPTEGDLAPASLPAASIQKVYFDKVIDASALKAIRWTSMVETAAVAKSYGVEFHRISKSDTECNPFGFLSEAPSDFQSFWTSASEGAPAGGFIAGLYLYLNAPEVASTSRTAMIGIRSDANRWIEVHEFTHHLFELEAAKAGQGAIVTQSNLKLWVEALNTNGDAYDESQGDYQSFVTLVSSFEKADAAIRRITVQFPLEEVTIETMLQEARASGTLHSFPSRTSSSNSYISLSAKKALKTLESLQDLTDKLREEDQNRSGLSRGWPRSRELGDRFNVLTNAHTDLRNQIKSVVSRTQSFSRVNSALIAGRFEQVESAKAPLANDESATSGSSTLCSHSHGADEVLAQVTKTFDRLGKKLSTATRR